MVNEVVVTRIRAGSEVEKIGKISGAIAQILDVLENRTPESALINRRAGGTRGVGLNRQVADSHGVANRTRTAKDWMIGRRRLKNCGVHPTAFNLDSLRYTARDGQHKIRHG